MNNIKKLCHYCHKTVPTCLLTIHQEFWECSFCTLARLSQELQAKKQELLLRNCEQVNQMEQAQ